MGLRCYLAMTAAEFTSVPKKPPHPAWMSCHFSPGGRGLSNLPQELPQESMVILDDSRPPRGHDPAQVLAQLRELAPALLLLDFQRRGDPETAAMAQAIAGAFPDCGIALPYWQRDDHPVLLPPIPPEIPAAEYLSPWTGRRLWLEAAPDTRIIRITEQGAVITPGDPPAAPPPHHAPALHCHYAAEILPDEIRFTLHRTSTDLRELLADAEALGTELAVGLYAELAGIME